MNARPELLVVAVPAAVLAAFSFGLTGILQHRATQQVPTRLALRPQLLLDLARRRIWVLSVFASVVGFIAQVIALRFAPLALVQPLLVTNVLFAVVIGAAMARRSPDRTMVLGALACGLGLAAFILIAEPSDGADALTYSEVLPLALGLAVIVGGCLITASRTGGLRRVLALALATGVLYGVTAGLIKVLTEQWGHGATDVLTHGALYAVCVIGPVGFLLSQNTYQAGTFVSPALAVITVVDPLVAIGVGVLWLGESLNSSGWAVFGQVVSLMVMIGGVVALAHRAPELRAQAATGARR